MSLKEPFYAIERAKLAKKLKKFEKINISNFSNFGIFRLKLNRFDHLIDQIGRTASQCTQEGHKSCLFMLFGTQQYNKNYDFNRIFHKFFGAESPLTRILFQSLSQSVELTANLMIEDLKSDLLTTDIFEAIDGYEEKIAKRITSMTDLEYQLELLKENLVRISEKFKIQYIDKLAHLGLTFRSDQGTEVKFVIFPIFDRNLLQNSDKIKEWRKFKKVVLEGEQNTFGARNHANKGSSEGREGQRGAKKAQNSEKSCYIEFVKSGLETARKVNFVLILDSDHDNFKDNIPILNEISRMSQELKIRLKNDYIQKSGSKQPPAANHHSTPSLKTPEGFGMSRTTGLGQNSGLGQNPAFSGFLGGGGIDSSVSNYANLLVRNIDNFVNDTNLFINENHQQKDFFKNRQKQVGYFEKKLDGIEKGIAGVEGAPHPQNSLLKNQLIDSQLKLRKLKNKLEYVYRSSEAKRKGLNSASPGLEQPRNGSFRNLGKGSFFGPERQNQPFGDLSGVDKASSPYVAFSRRRFSSEKKLLSPFHRTGAGEVFDARRASENAPASIKALNGLNGAPGGHIYAQNQPLFGPQNQRNFRTYGVPGAAGGYTMGPYGHNMGFGGPRVPGSHRKQFLHNSAIMPDRGDPGYTNLKDELQEFKDAVIEQFQELRNTKKSKKSKKSKTGYFASPGKNSIKIHQSYAADGTSTPKKSQNHKKSLQNFFNKRYASYNNIKENDPENRLNRPPYSPESDDEHPNQESFDTDYKIKKSSKNVKNMATNLLAFAQHSIRRHDKHKLVNIKRLKKENKRMKGSIKELKKMLQEKDKALQEMKQNEIRSEIKHDQQSQQLTALKTANSALESEVKILTEKLENLKENAKIEKNAKNEKKLKWTTLKENYEDLIEELKEAINEVNNEKLVLEAKCAENERIAEQKTELGNRLNSEVLKLREDIEEFQTQAIDIQDLSSQIQNKNVELTIKMDALKEQNEELVERCEELAADKDQLSNEFYAYKAMVEDSEDKDLQEKVQEVGALRGELEQVRLQLQAEGIKGKDLEGMVEMLKEQLEDQDELAAKGEEVGRQLGEAQNRVRELEEELEEVAGLRDLEQQKLVVSLPFG